ncbi:MAG: hypothetical protein HOE54_04245 [Gammaproteobacteria bacterium]|nr:hypothetical protein [Gammaproteobacteria bacterium]
MKRTDWKRLESGHLDLSNISPEQEDFLLGELNISNEKSRHYSLSSIQNVAFEYEQSMQHKERHGTPSQQLKKVVRAHESLEKAAEAVDSILDGIWWYEFPKEGEEDLIHPYDEHQLLVLPAHLRTWVQEMKDFAEIFETGTGRKVDRSMEYGIHMLARAERIGP